MYKDSLIGCVFLKFDLVMMDLSECVKSTNYLAKRAGFVLKPRCGNESDEEIVILRCEALL